VLYIAEHYNPFNSYCVHIYIHMHCSETWSKNMMWGSNLAILLLLLATSTVRASFDVEVSSGAIISPARSRRRCVCYRSGLVWGWRGIAQRKKRPSDACCESGLNIYIGVNECVCAT
jgi:hypothetical protein